MIEEAEMKNGFLSASQLLETRNVGNAALKNYEESESTLPKLSNKYFEPSGSWLEQMQLENNLKNSKKIIEVERVERLSQLASAEWLPGSQKARVIKKSGQRWENFGYEEKNHLFLLPEEALILLEMNSLELLWNGMPLSIQQAYEIIIYSKNSKCTIHEYKVFSHLIKLGYKVQRYKEKPFVDSKSSSTKRIIMNPDGLWTPNTSPSIEKQGSEIMSNNETEDVIPNNSKSDTTQKESSPKIPRIGILCEETVIEPIKIVKLHSVPSKDSMTPNQKWPGSRIQRNIKLMPKRADLTFHNSNAHMSKPSNDSNNKMFFNKRKSTDCIIEEVSPKKPRPEVIELSDDEVEEIPRPLTREEILATLPNLAGPRTEPLIVRLPRAYLPSSIKPINDTYRYDRYRLLNFSQTQEQRTDELDNSVQVINGNSSHFYSNPAVESHNNGYAGSSHNHRFQERRYIHQNISHNAIQHSPYPGTVFHSNYVTNFVMEVMGSMVRSFRQQHVQQTATFCPNMPLFPSHAYNPLSVYYPPQQQHHQQRDHYGSSTYRKSRARGRYESNRYEEPNVPSFTKRSGCNSWSELKSRWQEESTITIEDEEPVTKMTGASSPGANDIQVIEEAVKPLVPPTGTYSLSEAYERLRIIKSTGDRTVRSRKIDYSLSYEIYPISGTYRKSAPGAPLFRLLIINSKFDTTMDLSKLHRLQQESKDAPIIVASVSQSSISFIHLGIVQLPNYS
ncbi:hypothetical protein TKK_0017056 [Trichogramma kaykai]